MPNTANVVAGAAGTDQPSRSDTDTLPRRRLAWSAALIGFALGGFFDGILLHQILQWHHLLSAVERPGLADLTTQVVADGAFHAAHYVIALVGLWLLLRALRLPGAAEAGARLGGMAAIGFGAWHAVDAVLAHWVLGLHRIRMDVPDPLFWDVLWLVLFGLGPIAGGLLLQRYAARRVRSGGSRVGAAVLAIVAVTAGMVAARSPADGGPLLVVFERGAPDAAMDAVTATRSGLLGFDARSGLWILDVPPGTPVGEFYARGARYAGRSPVALGCLSWTKA